MNGEEFYAGKHALALRKRCMKEHLGLLPGVQSPAPYDIDVSDPVAESFFDGVWRRIATNNTEIFEDVFKALPTDKVILLFYS